MIYSLESSALVYSAKSSEFSCVYSNYSAEKAVRFFSAKGLPKISVRNYFYFLKGLYLFSSLIWKVHFEQYTQLLNGHRKGSISELTNIH